MVVVGGGVICVCLIVAVCPFALDYCELVFVVLSWGWFFGFGCLLFFYFCYFLVYFV